MMKDEETEFVVSATECTGIAPVPAETPAEAESDRTLYSLTKQKCSGPRKKN